jgi:serine/threonine-protein kinase
MVEEKLDAQTPKGAIVAGPSNAQFASRSNAVSLEVGQVLGGTYLVERLIGRGSMGLVYEARDSALNRSVAIRLIDPDYDNERVAGFNENDAKVAGQLGNKHVAELFNIGFLPSGERCIVTEFVEGEILLRRMKRLGCMSELAVAQLLVQLLEGLAAVHEAGIIHRDLTPHSIFIVPNKSGTGEIIKIIDFGISRLQLLAANPEVSAASISADTESFQCLSPEQLNGLRELDPRSNIYSLGVIAYQAITDRLPFEGKDFAALTFNILQEDPKPVEELVPESSSPFAQLIRKAMARSPNARFQYAEEMFAAISNWANRAGISQAELESGIKQEQNREMADPVSSERASVAPEAPVDGPAWDAVTADAAEFRVFANERSKAEAAEEAAMFGAPPVAPVIDALPFIAAEELAAIAPALTTEKYAPPQPAAVTAEEVPKSAEPPQYAPPQPAVVTAEEVPKSAEPPQYAPPQPAVVTAEEVPKSAEPPQYAPPQPAVVTAEEAPKSAEPPENEPPLPATENKDSGNAAAAAPVNDSAFRMSRTMLGIGGVVVRAPQSVEPGLHAVDVVQSAGPSEFRQRQPTEPGIRPSPAVDGALALLASARTSAVSASQQAQPVQRVVATVPTPAQPSALEIQPAIPDRAVSKVQPRLEGVAADDVDDLGPYGKSTSRSRKPLVIAILLIGLVGAGIAFALLPGRLGTRKSAAPRPAQSAVAAPTVQEIPSVVPTQSAESVPTAPPAEAKIENKIDEGTKDLATAVRKAATTPTQTRAIPSVAAVARPTQSKAQRPARAAQNVQGSTVAAPSNKQGSSKAAVGYDPYKYR